MFALTLLLSAIPKPDVLRDQFDLVEVNHYYDKSASIVFSQVIWYDWNAAEGRFDVAAWRVLKDVRERPQQVEKGPDGWVPPGKFKGGHATPMRRWDRQGVWVSQWYDEKDRCWREVAATHYRETTTQHDPELLERTILPDEQRKGLRRPRKGH